MSDIFLSYAKEDRGIVRDFAARLQASGISVWFDSALIAGEDFADSIKKQLDLSRAVVVVWSPRSVRSRWVRSEAQEGLSQGKLISVRTPDLDVAQIPLGFGSLHSYQLGDFDAIARAISRVAASVPLGNDENAEKGKNQEPSDGPQKERTTAPRSPGGSATINDVFVAYSRLNTDVCEELVVQLRAQNLDVFYDQFIEGGDEWREMVAQNIRASTVFVVMLSDSSVASAEVKRELNLATSMNKSLVPARVDGVDLPDAFKLILGGVQIMDASARTEPQIRAIAERVKTIVALRAFDNRKRNTITHGRSGDPWKESESVALAIPSTLVPLTALAGCAMALFGLGNGLMVYLKLQHEAEMYLWTALIGFVGVPYVLIISWALRKVLSYK